MNIGLLGYLSPDPLVFLIVIAALLFGLVLHNVVQSLVASSQGDDTPRNNGFTGTDPRVHLDPFYLLFLLLLGFAIPRPIPLNPRNVRGRGGPEALVWLSGPLALVVWAFVLLVAAGLLGRLAPSGTDAIVTGLSVAAVQSVQFAVVYLVPVPPLDGARALIAAGNAETRRFMRQLEGYGPIGFIVIFLVLSYTGVLSAIARPVYSALAALLGAVGL